MLDMDLFRLPINPSQDTLCPGKKIILAEAKKRNLWNLWTPLSEARPFPLKIFDKKISLNSTSSECI